MTKFRFLTAGESHGQGLNVIIEGLPANLDINENYIENDMSRRQKGYGSGGRMKIEKDRAEIKSGVRHGKTLGSPISLWIENKDWKNWTVPMSVEEVDPSEDIKVQTRVVPGHADFAGSLKYNHKDSRNVLERASARETAARVAAGSICRKFLSELGIEIKSRVKSVGWESSEINDIESIEWGFVEKSEVRASNEEEDIKFKKVIDKVKEAIELMDLSDKIDEPVKRLSGGQQRRVAIARTMAQGPKLILADEFLSELDDKTIENVWNTMVDYVESNNITLVIVEHNVERAKLAKRCFKLEKDNEDYSILSEVEA